MPTKPKIKIEDDSELRAEIDRLYEITEQVELAKWSIKCAKHILPSFEVGNIEMSAIESGIRVNEFWQVGKQAFMKLDKQDLKYTQSQGIVKRK